MLIASVIRGWIKPDGELRLVGKEITHDRSVFKDMAGFRYKAQAIAKAFEDGWIRVCDNAIEIPRPDDALLRRARNYVLDHPEIQAMDHIIIEWKSDDGQMCFMVPVDEFLELTNVGELYGHRQGRWV